MLLKKYLVFSITFVFLFVNSVYGSPKLKENFSIDKLIEYKAQMMINSQQDQKARNLTPKEKNDIKKQYETEILNWKATLETKLDWKDENYQQKLDFYIDKAFKDNPYLEDKFFQLIIYSFLLSRLIRLLALCLISENVGITGKCNLSSVNIVYK